MLFSYQNHTITISLNRQSHGIKSYLQNMGRPSSTLLAHLFVKIDSFLLFWSLSFGHRASADHAQQQKRTTFAKQMCQRSCFRTKQISIFDLQIRLFAMRLTKGGRRGVEISLQNHIKSTMLRI